MIGNSENVEKYLKNWEKVSLKSNLLDLVKTDVKDVLDTWMAWQNKQKFKILDHIVGNINNIARGNNPITSIILTWPSWVWKTHTIESFAKLLLGYERAYTVVNCEQFSTQWDGSNMFWSWKWYIGYWDTPILHPKNVYSHYEHSKYNDCLHPLISKLKNFSIILFDEFEKMHPVVVKQLLWMLDKGIIPCTDWSKTEIRNSLVFFTSNLWNEDKIRNSNKNPIWFMREKQKDESIISKKFNSHFPPEFLWRIDDIIEFDYLTKEDLKNILKIELRKINWEMHRLLKWPKIEIDNKVYEYIISLGYNKEKGARDLIRVFSKNISSKIWALVNDIWDKLKFRECKIKVVLKKGILEFELTK